ncbi:MAG: hypothetical protein GX259_01250 [Bacteroidales bacterium]|jgi:hypothetical protein|nr:hypothetical protein [Bacteroidales bacterium]
MKVPPYERTPYDSKEKWEKVFKKLPKDTLSIFIFDSDTLAKYSWDRIRSDYNILKRYDLSLKDLETQNWTISYP